MAKQTISRPPRGGRGLKSFLKLDIVKQIQSPPSRGAWIEISFVIAPTTAASSPPSRGAWIEIRRMTLYRCSCAVAPLAGGVD